MLGILSVGIMGCAQGLGCQAHEKVKGRHKTNLGLGDTLKILSSRKMVGM